MTLLVAAAAVLRSLPVSVAFLLLVVVLVFEAAFAAAGGNNDVAPVSYAMLSGAERRAQSIASFDRRDELEDIVAVAAAKATAKKRGDNNRQGRRVASGPEGGGGRYWKGLSGRTSWTGFYTDDFDREGIVVPERKKKAAEEEEEEEEAESIDEKKRRAKLKKKKRAVREKKAGRRGHRAPSASSRRPRRRRAGTKKNDVDYDVPPPLERVRYFFPSDLKQESEGSRSMWFEYPQRGREMVRTVPRSMGFYSNDLVQVETWVN